MQVLSYLRYGPVGLCGVLAFLAYVLLSKEQKATKPRKDIIRLIRAFMVFSLLAMAIGVLGQVLHLPDAPAASDPALVSGLDVGYLTAKWRVDDGHDTDFGSFRARYTYDGMLGSRVEGGELVLEGEVRTLEGQTGVVRGTARFVARGPISNNHAATHYTYASEGVKGFGTAFFEFDTSGHAVGHLVFRITRVLPAEGDVGAATLSLVRLPSDKQAAR